VRDRVASDGGRGDGPRLIMSLLGGPRGDRGDRDTRGRRGKPPDDLERNRGERRGCVCDVESSGDDGSGGPFEEAERVRMGVINRDCANARGEREMVRDRFFRRCCFLRWSLSSACSSANSSFFS